ncbi:MAG: PAC2 family protein [Planctomycetes bacterium]|nr:PAC2 family protein [Planctomycetota bacterium]
METPLRSPWLVAVWPGMGAVAQLAGAHLVKLLGAEPVAALDPRGFFEPGAIGVHAGKIQSAGLPKSPFFAWRDPQGRRDLLVLVGEAQPAQNAFAYARALLDVAASFHVERVFTFAAMASPIQPGAEPRVLGATTSDEWITKLREAGVVPLQEGEIGGLNGVFLAAAHERGLDGVCLLGEFPFFAANVPAPRASAAVLEAFARLAELELDVTELLDAAGSIETALREHLERAQQALGAGGALESPGTDEPRGEEGEPNPATDEPGISGEAGEDETRHGAAGEAAAAAREEALSPEVSARIEALFRRAQLDRAHALELKQELDRRGLFRRYEDRFLDLFRKAS